MIERREEIDERTGAQIAVDEERDAVASDRRASERFGARGLHADRHVDLDSLVAAREAPVCDGLRDDDDSVRREVLAHAGSCWSFGVVHTLGVYGRLRHAEIGRLMHGVTQRMLTLTLRQLERDGLVRRHDFEEVPHGSSTS